MFIESTNDVGSRVIGAIRNAAQAAGAGFDYLLKTAMRESNLDPNAKASTSSAAGLFQFVDQTWLSTLKQDGPALGYGRYADAIVHTSSGNYLVPDAAARQKVMNLRYDPSANAAMAGALTKRNAVALSAALGRAPSDSELYMAHFLGQAGAAKLIGAARQAPQANAVKLFPEAARANRPVFYDGLGASRSVGQVYAALASGQGGATPAPVRARSLPAATPAPVAPVASAPADSAPATADGVPAVGALGFAADTKPKFHSLFSDDRDGPVSPLVGDLWGANAPTPPPGTAAPAATPASSTGRIGTPLDLFQFLRPEIRAQIPPST